MDFSDVVQVVLAASGAAATVVGFLVAKILDRVSEDLKSVGDDIRAMRGSVQDLNIKMAVVVERVDSHDQNFEKVHLRLERVEQPGHKPIANGRN